MELFELTILGSNSAVPAFGRFPTSQVLKLKHHSFLIDCGEGAQIRMAQYKIKSSRIHQIFISHLHGDHIFGLPGLLRSFQLSSRKDPIEIFGPSGLKEWILSLENLTESPFSFPLVFHEVDTLVYKLIFENEDIEVYSIPLKHRVPTSGFKFVEKRAEKNVDKEKIKELSLSIDQIKALKRGEDIFLERAFANEELTLNQSPSRSYAFCSDTIYDETIIPFIQGVNVLYHETTYLHELAEQAKDRFHTTAYQAATIARMANVGKLVTGHYSNRYKDLQAIHDEALSVFDQTILGQDGSIIVID